MKIEPLFDLRLPQYSYMIGFIQADGSLLSFTRGRGRLWIELSEKDLYILEKFKELIPVNSTLGARTRNTNFKNQSTSVFLRACSKKLRETIHFYGVPYGKKSNIIEPPIQEFSEADYWRGIVDADGSLGMTGAGFPFLSLVTMSENLSNAFCNFIHKHTNFRPSLNRNIRDGIYNIMVNKEKCQKIISILYYENCLCLPRKYESSKNVLNWVRPKKIKFWSEEEELFLLNNSFKDCVAKFPDKEIETIRAKISRELKKKK